MCSFTRGNSALAFQVFQQHKTNDEEKQSEVTEVRFTMRECLGTSLLPQDAEASSRAGEPIPAGLKRFVVLTTELRPEVAWRMHIGAR